MKIKVYRLVAQDASTVFVKNSAQRRPAGEVLITYQSAELAALSAVDSMFADELMVRETLLLPNNPSLHEFIPPKYIQNFSSDYGASEYYFGYLSRCNLLSVWLPSSLAAHEHLVLLNTAHPAFQRIEVKVRYLNLGDVAALHTECLISET